MKKETVIIIGAGPAGLTAAYELSKNKQFIPIVFEATNDIGGISKTVNFKGYHIDIGGHRFFSKSDRVMEWWNNIMPFEKSINSDIPKTEDNIMLLRKRVSRILYTRKFFDYPIRLTYKTLVQLGFYNVFLIGVSYLKSMLFPIKPELSLEDFLVNRFGEKLYATFFKDYTKKVWGVYPDKISAEWGVQRIKGLSVVKTILHALSALINKKSDVKQKNVETSLIEQFYYPKYGPGQLWETVAKIIIENDGQIYLNKKIVGINYNNNKILSVDVKDTLNNNVETVYADYFCSTMPIKDLINSFNNTVPNNVKNVANNLIYRDFITVGLLLKKINFSKKSNVISDNWIYIQETDVKVGRIQFFNNWSPYMVKDKNKIWIGLEYFCNENDEMWKKTNDELIKLALNEIVRLGFADNNDFVDATVIRMPKAYPAYFGDYNRFGEIREFLDAFENLFLIGRNGMHRYNNQDHSMLTAMIAVNNIINNIKTKNNIWSVNTESEYHEEK